MTSFRYRDEEPLSRSLLYVLAGVAAGFAAGAVVAHRFGGPTEIANRVRDRFGGRMLAKTTDEHESYMTHFDEEDAYMADEFDAEFDDVGVGPVTTGERRVSENVTAEEEELEQRVLEAYRNDPILNLRAVDIGAITDGIVELTGWVNSEQEAEHAVTVARGVPGVDTVVNRLAVKPKEDQFEEFAERYADGDPALTERHWEGQRIGTGRRRQGNSSEPDRHADPRPTLEDRWTREDAAIAQAADDVGERGQRRARPRGGARQAPGGRADGSPVAPSGVPKADHVEEPEGPPRAD